MIKSVQNKKFDVNNKKQMFWCYSCQKAVNLTETFDCPDCNGNALEEIQEDNNPSQFVAYQVPSNSVPTVTHVTRIVFSTPALPMDFLMGQFMSPTINFFSTSINEINPFFINLFGAQMEELKKSVPPTVYQKLRKTNVLVDECAICQQKGQNGVQLPCKHIFHDSCIKPWFQNKNSCPCCRTQVTQ